MKPTLIRLALGACLSGAFLSAQESGFADPPGGWDLVYEGDVEPAMDGWDYDNGSDAWDGSTIGVGRPGGAGVFTDGDDTFLRIQDTGNPGNDPSNRKIYFTKDLTPVLSPGYSPLAGGVTMYFRTRVAIRESGPLDNYSDGRRWPPLGDGYALHNGGKSVIGIWDQLYGGSVSFAPSTSYANTALGDFTGGEGLVMNRLNGAFPSEEVDGDDAAGTANVLDVIPQDWMDVWVTLEADSSGGGTHRADIYLSGESVPRTFHLTSGSNGDESYTYAVMGLGATPETGAVDIDFFLAKEGVHVPLPTKKLRVTEMSRLPSSNELMIQWESSPGKLYNLRSELDSSNGDPAQWPIFDGQQGLVATPPKNTLVVPMPADERRFFVVGEFDAPPVIMLSDDLESGAGGWTTVINDPGGNTRWELGAPEATTGPLTGAEDSSNAWSTNLGDYGADSNISLRSPVLDMSTVAEAELSFMAFRDADGVGDIATVRFLGAVDLVQLGAATPLDMTVFDTDWIMIRMPVVPEAIGQDVIIEWNFVSDGGVDAFSGLSIDNVQVTD
jgi:hypothetical protein